MRTAVIGGGPAGLMAAANLDPRFDITLFERNPRPGRKLLLSGSGQCNITHAGSPGEFLPRYGDHGRFLRPALYAFPPESLLDFFRRRGLAFHTREDGKIFPSSGRAGDVLDILVASASRARIKTDTRVLEVEKADGAFLIRTAGPSGEAMHGADRIVIATGGLSYPATGSTGDGYRIASSLGHSIADPRPALCGILSSGFSSLAGNTFPGVEVSLFRSGKIIRRRSGDLLFTHKGVSGPVILDLSRHILAGDLLAVNFLYPGKPEEFLAEFPALVRKEPRKNAGSLLADYPLTRALEDLVLSTAQVARDKRRGDLSSAEIRRLAESLVRFSVPVSEVEGFDSAMVTAGGVAPDEVSPATMESRIVPGLYFAGEVLDADGDTGGFNLQAAFSTGYLAARSISL